MTNWPSLVVVCTEVRMLANHLKNFKDYREFKNRLGKEKLQVVGLSESVQLLFAEDLLDDGPVLAVFSTQDEAKRFYALASENLGNHKVLYYPSPPYLPVAVFASSKDAVRMRANVLHRIAGGEKLLIVAPVEALAWKLAKSESFAIRRLKLSAGEKVEEMELLAELIAFGYERVDMVIERGQFAKRGGIIDVFTPDAEYPLRMELWGDEIDSLRYFDQTSQRSIEKIDTALVLPVNEISASNATAKLAAEKLQKELSAHKGRLAKLKDITGLKSIEEQIVPFIEAFQQGIFKEGFEQFNYLFESEKALFSAYFSAGSILLFNEKKLTTTLTSIMRDKELALADYLASGYSLPGFIENFWPTEEIIAGLSHSNIVTLEIIPQGTTPYISFINKDISSFNGDSERFKTALDGWRKAGYCIVITVATAERGKRLQDYLGDLGIHPALLKQDNFPLQNGGVYLAVGNNIRGVEAPSFNLVLINESEIFGVFKKKTSSSKRAGQKITSFVELKVGDYVVHTNHGIGVYKGVEKVTALGVEKDYLVIQYAGTDKLYIPTDQVGRVQKYVGSEGHVPKLNKLGNADWAKAKSRIKESVQEMAVELLKLYAERQALPGHAFSPDTHWQSEFEDAFPYEETPDQKRAVSEIKADMEKTMPMDRLLCGDVGYGKTEVAMRAAFKAVNDGKQVAILVPTTVLAQQHELTFTERYKDYPFTISSLSRFKSPKDQKLILESAKIGTLDILIGTHRILSKDVRFKNLGLLIVDEEQRFGVAHKEKIKQLLTSVDVLTLTATPIPRTLHMSLVSMRDMSVIETPPEDRLPVQTYVLEYNERVIEEAINSEISRGGQVFFVHNRVQDIRRFGERIQNLIPEAKVVIAHGQMNEDELEEVMRSFVEKEANVLIATTIIESGLDMPNVNTIIVDEAERLGLSQMYQLRGRVGRSARQAYAYFTYRRDKILTDIAQKRLKAIRDFTELGAGFKIAMRDLELRGAGNILGPEQSGNIMSVGFDMYLRLLEEAVEELRGIKQVEKEPVVLELPVSAFLPDAYVEDSAVKTEIYHKLLAAVDETEVRDIREETEDRFGNLPLQTENLFILSALRVLAEQLAIKQISYKNNKIHVIFAKMLFLSADKLAPLISKYGRRLELDFQLGTEIRLQLQTMSEKEILQSIYELLTTIKVVVSGSNEVV